MTAGNTSYQTVRTEEMLPHHDLDTTTTPNSWKPKAGIDLQKDECGNAFANGTKNLLTADLIRPLEVDVPIAATSVLVGANIPAASTGGFVDLEREAAVLVINNPHPCLNLKVNLITGGFESIQMPAVSDTQALDRGIVLRQEIVVNGTTYFNKGTQVFVGTIYPAGIYTSTNFPKMLQIPPGGTMTIDRATMYSNNNGAGENPQVLAWRMSQIKAVTSYV